MAGQPTTASTTARIAIPSAKRTIPQIRRARRGPGPDGVVGRTAESGEAEARASAGFMGGSAESGDPDGQKRFQFLGKWEGDILLHRLELLDGLNTQLLAA